MTAILHAYAYSTAGEKAAAESAAVLRKWYHEKGKGSTGSVVLIREWAFMDKRSAYNFAAALTDTVVDPKADGKTYSGTFVSQKPVIEGADAPTVVQTLVLSDATGLTITYAKSGAAGEIQETVAITHRWDRTVAQYNTIVANYSDSVVNRVVLISAPTPNRNGLIDFTVTVITYIALEYSYVSDKTKDGTATTTKYKNSLTIPALTESEEFASLSKTENPQGSWDGVKKVVNYDDGLAVFVSSTLNKIKKVQPFQTDGWYLWTHTFSINYFRSPHQAHANISGGYEGSGVSKVLSLPNYGGLWRATKIYKVERSALQPMVAGAIISNA